MLILNRIEYTIKSIKKMLLIKFDMKNLGVASINIEQKKSRIFAFKDERL